MKIYKIETANGVYTVKNPTGELGALHFAIIQSCAPSSGDPKVVSPADQKRASDGYREWSTKVLKNILIEGESACKYEDMPGEDQYAIFVALMSQANISEDLFRIIE